MREGLILRVLLTIAAVVLLIGTLALVEFNQDDDSRAALYDAQKRLDKAERDFDDARMGATYACGFLSGQNSVIRTIDVDSVIAIPPDSETCRSIKALADKNGFHDPK